MSKKLLKSTAVVGIMTFVSRISGLMRDVVIANIIGTGVMADAFFVAFRIPNFLRRIFGEGAFSQAFIPVFTELRAKDDIQARQFVNHMAGQLGLVVFILSVAGTLFAPWLVKLFAYGYIGQPEKLIAATDALRIMFPYLFCVSMVAMSGAVLNTTGDFAVPAFTPVLLNISLILAALWLAPNMQSAASALAFGVLFGGIVQLVFQMPFLLRRGLLPKPKLGSQEASTRVFKLMVPAMFGISVAQINVLIGTLLASFLVTGSVSWLYYSDRLMEFPIGVFGIALATVVLPSLAKVHSSGSAQAFSDLLDWALRWVILIALPACIALMLLATPLVSSIYQLSTVFSVNDVAMSANALVAYSIGVVGIILVKVLAPGFYARQDIKTPVRIGVIAMLVNIGLSIILVQSLAHVGLALSVSLAAWVNAGLLYRQLVRDQIYRPLPGWLTFTCKVSLACLAMAVFLWWLSAPASVWIAADVGERLVWLLRLVVGGIGIYFGVLYALGLRPTVMLLKPSM
ncbi:MAG: murein biosynthesis integral membrane protein MurJ [Arenicellaceae bacterium]|nr:murein biosynthesis integral membrane protein MurJ [Arenicellaceae bacterium]